MKIGNNGNLVLGPFDESTPCLMIVLMNYQTKLRINHLTAVKSVAILESVSWSTSVSVTELRVPSMAVLGESVTLVCSYDLGNEELYVVKWYKDELEFYRFEPKDHNQSVYFPQPGINIDCDRPSPGHSERSGGPHESRRLSIA
ncbi:uncharacterized protein TNCV_3181861 [Trichonephila clavipes]|nr:uncharacterized protein TNCV_3181861 [Trichonephila clavipes]